MEIGKSIFKRFGRKGTDKLDLLLDFTREGLTAGEYLTSLGKTEIADMGRIPVNPYLWGDDAAGRRVLAITETVFGDDLSKIEVRTEMPDFTTLADLYDDLAEEAERRLRKSPRNPFLQSRVEALETDVHVIFAERGW